ncbi:hypothetical protein BN1044_01371 [Hafnia alvei]|uniref:Uncharacterized protein n=1 Tax=Hafnia alvei TaxID=569 RepID=A0A1C6YYN7_HAFAL|nr:hypothetical protein BN1044_01371 [Hafnia alvei]
MILDIKPALNLICTVLYISPRYVTALNNCQKPKITSVLQFSPTGDIYPQRGSRINFFSLHLSRPFCCATRFFI